MLSACSLLLLRRERALWTLRIRRLRRRLRCQLLLRLLLVAVVRHRARIGIRRAINVHAFQVVRVHAAIQRNNCAAARKVSHPERTVRKSVYLMLPCGVRARFALATRPSAEQ